MKNELTDKEQRLEIKQYINDMYDLGVSETKLDKLISLCKQYHQPDNNAVDLDGNQLKVGDEMIDTTGEICGVIELKNGRLILSQGQDALGRDKFDYLEDAIKVGYKLYIKSPPKAISEGESECNFADWITQQDRIKVDAFGKIGWVQDFKIDWNLKNGLEEHIFEMINKNGITTTELYKQFKTDTK